MGAVRFSGVVLSPGAGGRRTQSGLVAIDDALTENGIHVERIEFPGQAAGRRRPDPPQLCIETIRDAVLALADRISVPPSSIAVGGRSFGGRMSSLAVADGLEAAALVLVSYPLHPPGKPDQLRTAHFGKIRIPCLFVSGRRDAFASPEELVRETATVEGKITLVFVEGDHSLRRSEREVAANVAAWAASPG